MSDNFIETNVALSNSLKQTALDICSRTTWEPLNDLNNKFKGYGGIDDVIMTGDLEWQDFSESVKALINPTLNPVNVLISTTFPDEFMDPHADAGALLETRVDESINVSRRGKTPARYCSLIWLLTPGENREINFYDDQEINITETHVYTENAILMNGTKIHSGKNIGHTDYRHSLMIGFNQSYSAIKTEYENGMLFV